METKTVSHVDVWSAAKLFAAINLVLSIIIGIFAAIAAVFGAAAIPGVPTLVDFGSGIVAAIIAIIIIAIIGMILGFILGAIYAVIYNLAAGVFGGLKIELE